MSLWRRKDEKATRANSGEEGKVDEAQALMKKVVGVFTAKNNALLQLFNLAPTQEKKMALCEICGSFLVANNVTERTQSHVTGKQHLGYNMVREYLAEYKVVLVHGSREERLAREQKAKEKRKREREREVEKTRENGKDQPREYGREKDSYNLRARDREYKNHGRDSLDGRSSSHMQELRIASPGFLPDGAFPTIGGLSLIKSYAAMVHKTPVQSGLGGTAGQD
ncbi:hypothetical protein L7F22_054202 [Adiantum nelumboides]|nr:hypothetical protein [Adiantum nelumboides]